MSVPVTTTWRVFSLTKEKRSAEMESSCEYIKKKNSPGPKSNGGPPSLCFSKLLTNSQLKELQCYHIIHNGLVRNILNKIMDRRFQQDP